MSTSKIVVIPLLDNNQYNLLGLLTGRKTLFSRPVKIISLYVPAKYEDDTLNIITDVAHLYRPGNGTVYSEPCHLYNTAEDYRDEINYPENRRSFSYLTELMGICCIVQRGEADVLARAMLQAGMGLPTIHFRNGNRAPRESRFA